MPSKLLINTFAGSVHIVDLNPTLTSGKDYERWFFEELDGAVADEHQPFDVDSRVSQAVPEDDIESGKTSLPDDFLTFLRYIVSNDGMKLTTSNSFIRRKDLFALNNLMDSPSFCKSLV